jgi:hypothetical protein
MSLARTDTALGAFYRRLAYRVGKANAITATARKLAILVSRPLKEGLQYQDPGAAAYDSQHCRRALHQLRHRAATLGFSSSIVKPASFLRRQFRRRQLICHRALMQHQAADQNRPPWRGQRSVVEGSALQVPRSEG